MAKGYTIEDLNKLGLIEVAPGVYQKGDRVLYKQKVHEIAGAYSGTTQYLGNTELNAHAKPLMVFEVDPIGKPRMTQSDKWKSDPNHKDERKRQRKPVAQYILFKNKVVAQAQQTGFTLPENGFHAMFFIAMPHSWSDKKKNLMRGTPHQSKPDADNLVKSLKDSLCENDAVIWDYRITKRWNDYGKIVIYKMK